MCYNIITLIASTSPTQGITPRSSLEIIIDYLGVGNRSGMLHNRPSDGVDPVLLLLLGIGDEVHGVLTGGDLESEGLVEDVLGALDGEAIGDWDDAAWGRELGHVGILEPQELTLLQHEPPAAPRLDVVPLLHQPPGTLRI